MQHLRQYNLRLSFAAAMLSSLTLVGSAAPTSPDSLPHLGEVQSLFLSPDAPSNLRAFKDLGPTATQATWEVLAGRARIGSEEFDVRACKALAQTVIATWPPDEVVPELLAAADSTTPVGQRLVLLEMLAWTDSAAGLSALFDVLQQLQPEELYSQCVRKELERALRILLKDNSHRFRHLEPLLDDMPHPVLSSVLRFAGNDASQEAGRLLVQAAKKIPAAEQLVLECLARCKPTDNRWNPQDFQLLARRALTAGDVKLQRLGVIAIGNLADATAFTELTNILERAEGSLHRTTLTALQQLSGKNRQWDANHWRQWFSTEQQRFATDRELGYGLASAEASKALVTIRTLTTHELFADDAAELIGRALSNHDATVRKLACEGFCALQNHAAIPLLALQLDDHEETVRTAAHASLCKLTGRNMGDTRAEWEDWWNGLH